MTRKTLTLILLIVSAAIVCLCAGCSVKKDPVPLARQGIIDLAAVDLMKSEPLRLDGAWEFYWKQLLTPDDFHGAHPTVATHFLSLPIAWSHAEIVGEKASAEGYATFRLLVLPGREKQDLTLHLGELNSAYRLWADGVLLVENGLVGKSASTEVPRQAIRQPRLHLEGRPLELVLQLSNYHYREGGVLASIRLGAVEKLETEQQRSWTMALLCIGSLLVMGFYHVGLFCVRKMDRSLLYFGIYCLLWTISSITSTATDWAVNLLVAEYPPWLVYRLDLLAFVISLPVGYSFFRTLYPDEFSRRIEQLIILVAILYAVCGVSLPTITFTGIIPLLYLFSMAMIIYCLAMLSRAMGNRREAAAFILIGFIAMGAAGINDMLLDLQIISSVYLIHVGMFVFILFQAMALSFRFFKSFSAVEQLSGELSDKNRMLEDEMSERIRLEREIVNVSEDERRRISHDLHDGLCQMLTGARLHFSALARRLGDDDRKKPEITEVATLLEQSVNHAYDLSRGLWPVEHGNSALSPSLEELIRRLAESSGVEIVYNHICNCHICSNSAVTQLYRIAQEALTNAVKHAKASRIVVALECPGNGELSLNVADNGIGRGDAARTKGGLGMGIMAHRARLVGGSLTVSDTEGGGTVVSCMIPCDI